MVEARGELDYEQLAAKLASKLLQAILKDSSGAELSDFVKNLDQPLSKLTLSELTLIPAVYYNGYAYIYGYSSYSGGGFSPDDFALTGAYWSSSTAGNYIEFQFYGTWFDVVFRSKSGVANIYVDGANIATVDVSALSGPLYNLVWHGPRNLSDDYHTVRVEVSSGTVYVVGILVDSSKNAWRIIPFPYRPFNSLYWLFYYGVSTTGLFVRGYGSSNPVYAEKFPGYKLYVYTTTALAANGVWTSSSVDCLGSVPRANKIYITCYSDQSGTIYVDYSSDGTYWDSSESISYTGGTTPAIAPIVVKSRYARIRYVNGATAQSVFRLYAYFMGD
jgi:hypothetical protein